MFCVKFHEGENAKNGFLSLFSWAGFSSVSAIRALWPREERKAHATPAARLQAHMNSLAERPSWKQKITGARSCAMPSSLLHGSRCSPILSIGSIVFAGFQELSEAVLRVINRCPSCIYDRVVKTGSAIAAVLRATSCL